MNRLVVPLTPQQQAGIFGFFLKYPQFIPIEEYLHTHPFLGNLEHYMWEEIYEPHHASIRQSYERTGYLTDNDVNTWMAQELQEKGNM